MCVCVCGLPPGRRKATELSLLTSLVEGTLTIPTVYNFLLLRQQNVYAVEPVHIPCFILS